MVLLGSCMPAISRLRIAIAMLSLAGASCGGSASTGGTDSGSPGVTQDGGSGADTAADGSSRAAQDGGAGSDTGADGSTERGSGTVPCRECAYGGCGEGGTCDCVAEPSEDEACGVPSAEFTPEYPHAYVCPTLAGPPTGCVNYGSGICCQ